MHILVSTSMGTWGISKLQNDEEDFHIATLALMNAMQEYKNQITSIEVRFVSDDYQIDATGVSASFIKTVYKGSILATVVRDLDKAIENADSFFQDVMDQDAVLEAFTYWRNEEGGDS